MHPAIAPTLYSSLHHGVTYHRIIAEGRLQNSKAWRSNHPVGFYAKPNPNNDGSPHWFRWTAGILGKEGTVWEGGVYTLTMEFSNEFPQTPPKCALRKEPLGFSSDTPP